MILPGYDEWKLRGPDEDRRAIGMKPGETCGRYPEPDEDMPPGYRRRPCMGMMAGDGGAVICDRCGEVAE